MSRTTRHIDAIRTAADHLTRHQANNTFARVLDASPVWGSSSNNTPTAGGGISDPTATAALTRDHAREDLTAIDRKLASAARHLTEAVTILNNYAARQSNTADQTAAGQPEPGCISCARLEAAPGIPLWEPPYRGVGTNALCHYCYTRRRRTGTLPTIVDLRRHHNGQRNKRAA